MFPIVCNHIHNTTASSDYRFPDSFMGENKQDLVNIKSLSAELNSVEASWTVIIGVPGLLRSVCAGC